MPPLRNKVKDTNTVCRVCASENAVLLELFGSKTQSISYAEDVNRCFSFEVKEGDGLPSKICIKCVGVISDCRPFVDKSLQTEAERRSSSEATSDSSASCYYCLSSVNILFPVPDLTVQTTKDCLDFEVTRNDKICIRCQFLLEGLHDLKLKAREVLKQFHSKSVPVIGKSSPNKEESVEDIVDNLKDKFNMDKRINKPFTTKRIETKLLEVKVVDIGRIFGQDFFQGTINVSDFWERLGTSSHMNGEVSSSKMKKAGPVSSKQFKGKKQGKVNAVGPRSQSSKVNSEQPCLKKNQKFSSEKTRGLSKGEEPEEIGAKADETSVSSEDVHRKKRSRELSESETSAVSKKPRTTSESDKSEKSLSLICSPTRARKGSRASVKKDGRPESENDQSVTLSTRKLDQLNMEKKKDSKKSKSKKGKSEVETSPQPTIVRPVANVDRAEGSNTENGLEPESSTKRRKRIDMNYVKFSDADETTLKGSKRKWKLGEDENQFGPKARGRKRQQKSILSHEDCGLDESTSGEKIVVEQPQFLKELDELLKFTPRATFTPFICTVCNEGYVSTVKGKLHKLVVHDPHSNIVLQLTRCDDGSELERLKDILRADIIENITHGQHNVVENDPVSDNGSENDSACVTETLEKLTEEVANEFDDDLFSDEKKDSNSGKGKSNEDMFDALFGGSKDEEPSDEGKKVQSAKTGTASVDESGQKTDECAGVKENAVDEGMVINAKETAAEEEKSSESVNDKSNEPELLRKDDIVCKEKDQKAGEVEVDKSVEEKNDEKAEEMEVDKSVEEKKDEKAEEMEVDKSVEEKNDKKAEEMEVDKSVEEKNDEKAEEMEVDKSVEEKNDDKAEEMEDDKSVEEKNDDKAEELEVSKPEKEKTDVKAEEMEVKNVVKETNDVKAGEMEVGRSVEKNYEEEEVNKLGKDSSNEEMKADQSKEVTNNEEVKVEKLKEETNDAVNVDQIKEESIREVRLEKSTEKTADEKTDVNKSREVINDDVAEDPSDSSDKEQSLQENAESKPTESPEKIEKNVDCDSSSVREEVNTPENADVNKSPASIEGDKEDHRNEGSEADVESNCSPGVDENSDDESRRKPQDTVEELEESRDSPREVSSEADAQQSCDSNADPSSQISAVSKTDPEGIVVGDN